MWTEKKLDELLTTPSEALIADMKQIEGDIMVLGAGGKMGPTLCLLAQNAIEKALAEPDFLIRLATTLKEEKARRIAVEAVCEEQQKQISLLGAQVDDLQLEVTGMKEKASYLDIILATTNSVLVTQFAQDSGESSIKFNRRLNRMGIQYSRGRQWILYAPYKDCGYVASETYLIKHKDGHEEVRMITKWTQKGRRFLYEELKTAGVLPVIERTASNG